jgi:hypothetical protein
MHLINILLNWDCNDIPPSAATPEDYFTDFECPANTLSYFKEISETEILGLLHGLCASKALVKILKIAAPEIAPSH